MNILVTGGAGYIGSHAVKALLGHGHRVVVIDNLSHGYEKSVIRASQGMEKNITFIRANVADREVVKKALLDHSIETVMHFAAFIEVGESVADPFKYYLNNFSNALALFETMISVGVKKLVFSSTAAVYGNPEKTPIHEDQTRAPINPYGRSKAMVEMAIEDFSRAYGLGYAILRYFNVAGSDPEGQIGEAHEPESHLIPRLLDSAIQGEKAQIFGTDYPTRDGTCVRDYVHASDLAEAHVLAMNGIEEGKGDTFNIGSENGFTVREVLRACEKVIGRSIETVEKPRRPGDPAVLIAESNYARKKLGWKPKYPELETMVAHAWKWRTTHPKGY